MRQFLSEPNKLGKHATREVLNLLEKNMPLGPYWKTKFYQSRIELSTFKARFGKNRIVKNFRYVYNVVGIKYKGTTSNVNKSNTDYLYFIVQTSNGLTQLGQKLLQHSIESDVYSVLGAQARTHWSIVGQGAKSLQTQDVFHDISKETIAQNDITVAITNMRKAIEDTNVVLNLAITPGVSLVPSNMIIQKEKITEYNNTLTRGMGFGSNRNTNYTKPKPKTKEKEKNTRIIQNIIPKEKSTPKA